MTSSKSDKVSSSLAILAVAAMMVGVFLISVDGRRHQPCVIHFCSANEIGTANTVKCTCNTTVSHPHWKCVNTSPNPATDLPIKNRDFPCHAHNGTAPAPIHSMPAPVVINCQCQNTTSVPHHLDRGCYRDQAGHGWWNCTQNH